MYYNFEIHENPFEQFFTYLQFKDYVEFMMYWVSLICILYISLKGILFLIDKLIPQYSIATAIDKIFHNK